MINLSINNFKLEFNKEISVLSTCNFIGLYVSRFCFHNSLAIAGNCLMCLIELFDQVYQSSFLRATYLSRFRYSAGGISVSSRKFSTFRKPPLFKKISSIDTSDSLCTQIDVLVRDNDIEAIYPNPTVHPDFLPVPSKSSFDGNEKNRITDVYIKGFDTHNFSALKLLEPIMLNILRNTSYQTIFVDNSIDLNTLYTIKHLSRIFKTIDIQSVSNTNNCTNFNINFLSNKSIDIYAKKSKICFIFGTNTRFESVLLNLKIRRKALNIDFDVFTLGLNFKNTFPFKVINLERKVLIKFFESKLLFLSPIFTRFKYPHIYISESIISRGWSINFLILTLKKIIPTAVVITIKEGPNSSGLSFLNIKSLSKSKLLKSSLFIGINLNENLKLYEYFTFISNNRAFFPKYLFNTHNSNPIFGADIVIPIFSKFEVNNIYMNFEDRPQKTSVCIEKNLEESQELMTHVLLHTAKHVLSKEAMASTFQLALRLHNDSEESFLLEILDCPLKFESISPIFSYFVLNSFFLSKSKILVSFDALKIADKDPIIKKDVLD